jgi:hypothetical protein
VNVPINTIGVLANLLALLVLQNKEFNIPLYKYLRVYCINSFIVNLTTLLLFTSNTSHLFEWSNTELSFDLFIYGLVPVNDTAYFFGSALDIFISLDRIGTFKKDLNKCMHKLSPYTLSFIVLICCLAIGFPFFFVYAPFSLTMNLNETFAQTVWFGGVTSYGKSHIGTILTFIIYPIRDIFLMVVEILVNIAFVYFIREYMHNRLRLLSKSSSVTEIGNVTVHRGNFKTRLRISLMKKTDSKPDEPQQPENAFASQASQKVNKERVSKLDRKLSVMVVIMCVFSVIEHLFYITCCAYPYFGSDAIMFHLLYYLAFLVMSIKHSLNLFLFYIFNCKFRSSFIKLFKRKSQST